MILSSSKSNDPFFHSDPKYCKSILKRRRTSSLPEFRLRKIIAEAVDSIYFVHKG